MSYTRPPGNAADARFGGAYTRPAGNAANASFQTGVVGVGEVVLGAVVAGFGAHGVAGSGAVALGIDVAGDGLAGVGTVVGVGAVELGLDVSGVAAHGVAGVGALALGMPLVEGSGAHGVRGSGAVVLGIEIAGVAFHPRYALRGEVRDGGVLVNRTVRAYRRDTGEMVGAQVTVAGRFDIHAGWEAREHYILPLDLGADAVDFVPPVANRVLSVLVED